MKKEQAKKINEELNQAINSVLNKYNIEIKKSNLNYNTNNDNLSLNIQCETNDPDKELKRLETLCYKFNIDPELIGQQATWEINGNTYSFVNIKPRNRKYPFILKKMNDKKQNRLYKFTSEQFHKMFKRNIEAIKLKKQTLNSNKKTTTKRIL